MSQLDDLHTPSYMTFGEHLDELRRRIIHALIGVGVMLAITMTFKDALFEWLIQPYLQVQRDAGRTPEIVVLTVAGGFGIYLKVSFVAAFILAGPWVLYQAWKFIAEGLYATERKTMMILAPFSGVMTILGVLFAYYVLVPVSLAFLLNFTDSLGESHATHAARRQASTIVEPATTAEAITQEGTPDQTAVDDTSVTSPATVSPAPPQPVVIPTYSDDPIAPLDGEIWFNAAEGRLKFSLAGMIHSMKPDDSKSVIRANITISDYIRFITLMMLGVAIAFQLPIVMLGAGWAGLAEPQWLAAYRKHAALGCLVLGAILTPTDIFSMALLAGPLYLLFEFGLILMRVGRKRSAFDPADDEL